VKQRKPNIVFIIVDDMGYNDVGYHNPEVKTPNIGRKNQHCP
jgi:arylsulfatase B